MSQQSMRFGTYTEFQSTPGVTDHADLIWDMIAIGEQADRLGFDVFTCLEHPWFEKFAIMPAPLLFFATLAQRTRNLRFRALCHTLPLHNPMVLAGELATADVLLNGRFDIGVGRGHAWLNDPANLVLEENVEKFAECLDIIVGTLANESFSYDGKYYRLDDLRVVPRPVQRPHPPIFQVGSSAKWFKRAAENGYACMLGGPAPTSVFREPAKLYRQLCEEAGTRPYLGWIKAIWLDEDEERAHRDARQPVLDFISYNVSPMHTLPRTTPEEKDRLRNAGYGFYAEDDFPSLEKLTYEQLIEFGIVFVGTPETVGGQLMELYDEFRFEELCIVSHFGAMAAESAMQTQRLFARDIMPRLRDASVSEAALQG
jgi:alkanesulfonate monooxygenase SsuD/methylene tetrahydromethanopterin reductase-like flavin-dependent oxidoreductase (luciferase family)